MIFSIIAFFILTIGLGFIIDLLIKNWSAGFLERIIIRMGAGILLIPLLGLLFNILSIPIYWPFFLLLSFILPGLAIYFRKEPLKKAVSPINIKRSHIYSILIFLLFLVSAYMYIGGSFAYPWFEDGDPYGYALVSKYISLEKTYEAPYYFVHYAYPYTQGYQIFMGLLHQTNDSLYWNMKFFNALIISFSILFFFYFCRKLTKKEPVAFWSTVTLVAIPAWLSHFIFSLNFNMALMPILFYSVFSISENKNWKYLAALFYGSIMFNHFYTSVVITVLLVIIYLLRVLVYKEFSKDYLQVIVFGFLIGLIFWVPALVKNFNLLLGGSQLGGLDFFLPLILFIKNSLFIQIMSIILIATLIWLYLKSSKWFPHVKRVLSKRNVQQVIYLIFILVIFLVLVVPSEKIIYAEGSGDRGYGPSDFFIAQKGNMINNPIGIGTVIMILFLIGLTILIFNFRKLFTKENFYLLVALTWVIFSYLGIKGVNLSIAFVPFRMWTFFGMALSIITGYAIFLILLSFNKLIKNKRAMLLTKATFIFIMLLLIYITSFVPKYWHNTAVWPEHQILVPESRDLFIWMAEGGLPKNSMVLPLCNSPSLVLGYDMLTKPWKDKNLSGKKFFESDPEPFFRRSLSQNLSENYNFLKKHGYEYTILGADCIAKMKANQTSVSNRVQEMINSPKFSLIRSTQSEFLFEVI